MFSFFSSLLALHFLALPVCFISLAFCLEYLNRTLARHQYGGPEPWRQFTRFGSHL